MKPIIEGCSLTGDIWSFRSEASDDLDKVYEMLSDIPRCDTKKEMLTLIKRSYGMLNIMEHRIKEKDNDYTLKDVIE